MDGERRRGLFLEINGLSMVPNLRRGDKMMKKINNRRQGGGASSKCGAAFLYMGGKGGRDLFVFAKGKKGG